MFKYYSNIQIVVFGPKYSNTMNICGNTDLDIKVEWLSL